MSLILRKLNFAADWNVVGRRCVVDPECCEKIWWPGPPPPGPGDICPGVPIPIPGVLYATITGQADCNVAGRVEFMPITTADVGPPPYPEPMPNGFTSTRIKKLEAWPPGTYPLYYFGNNVNYGDGTTHYWILKNSVPVYQTGEEYPGDFYSGPAWAPDNLYSYAPGAGLVYSGIGPANPSNQWRIPRLGLDGFQQIRPIGTSRFPNTLPLGFDEGLQDALLMEPMPGVLSIPAGADCLGGAVGLPGQDDGITVGVSMSPSGFAKYVGRQYTVAYPGGDYLNGFGVRKTLPPLPPSNGLYARYPFQETFRFYRQMMVSISVAPGGSGPSSCLLGVGFSSAITRTVTADVGKLYLPYNTSYKTTNWNRLFYFTINNLFSHFNGPTCSIVNAGSFNATQGYITAGPQGLYWGGVAGNGLPGVEITS